MANVEGLQKTLEYITEHPGEWNQIRWSTCFAGLSLRVLKGAVLIPSDCCSDCERIEIDGAVVFPLNIPLLAQEALELTGEQERELFRAENDLDTLTRLVAEFTAEVPVPA